MFKKVLVTAVLLSLLIAGNIFAGDEEDYYYNVQVEIHGTCNHLIVGYFDVNNDWHTTHDSYQTLTSGTYDRSFSVSTSQYPPETIAAEGWGPYAAHDYDECNAQLYGTNELELWLGVVPDPGEPEPQEE